MPLWGDQDTNEAKPKFGDSSTKYFVDLTERSVASNRAKGLKSSGWYDVVTYTDSQGNTRYKTELLVPMKRTAVQALDGSNTTFEDLTVADS